MGGVIRGGRVRRKGLGPILALRNREEVVRRLSMRFRSDELNDR